MDDAVYNALCAKATEIRTLIIEQIAHLGSGHIGGCMSVTDVLAVLYHHTMRVDPAKPQWEGRDYLVMSKGHAGPALYATLADKGYFPLEWLTTLNKGGTRLPSHCDRILTPGIDMTAGSLGQGFSAAVGMALGLCMDGKPNRVYAIIGDGESNEGQIWEAAMFAAAKNVGNIIAFLDYNKQQLDGFTKDVLDMGDMAAKWKAFGWFTQEVDGHDVRALDSAIEAAQVHSAQEKKPSMIIMHTIKGKGCNFAEGVEKNHSMAFDMEKAKEAIAALHSDALHNEKGSSRG